VNEACAGAEIPFESGFEELAAEAWSATMPLRHEWSTVLRTEAGTLLDRLLTRVARGHGALEVAIGEGLLVLHDRRRTMEFGYAGIGDYARERLGIKASTALKMARLAGRLREHPHLRTAVWLGHVTTRKAETILPVLRGEAEQSWVARARVETVHALQSAARTAGGAEPDDDEEWERICVQLSPEVRPVWTQALELAGEQLGPTSLKWQRIVAIASEYLGAHAPPQDDDERDGILSERVSDYCKRLEEALEKESAQWAFLDRMQPVAAPIPSIPVMEDAQLLDAELRRLGGLRERWDELFGHLASLFKALGLWRDAQFASFAHYCSERLGMKARAVEQRIQLDRKMEGLPELRRALREGRVSYEKARLIAWLANDKTIEQWIARAERTTCIALRREIDTAKDAQICARGYIDLRVPAGVRGLLGDAMRAARKDAGKWIPAEECLRRIAQHFIDTWKPALKRRNTVQRRVAKRDHGLCLVPGCSRAMGHVHHIVFRSRGGDHDPTNLVCMCAAHHLHGIHEGQIRVSGKAPDQLRWALTSAVRPDPGWSTVRRDDTAATEALHCCVGAACADGESDAFTADAQEIWSTGGAGPQYRAGDVEHGAGRPS
jgi:hypothetical protein